MNCDFCGYPCSRMCSGCQAAAYCNSEHQNAHWHIHKQWCKKNLPPAICELQVSLYVIKSVGPKNMDPLRAAEYFSSPEGSRLLLLPPFACAMRDEKVVAARDIRLGELVTLHPLHFVQFEDSHVKENPRLVQLLGRAPKKSDLYGTQPMAIVTSDRRVIMTTGANSIVEPHALGHRVNDAAANVLQHCKKSRLSKAELLIYYYDKARERNNASLTTMPDIAQLGILATRPIQKGEEILVTRGHTMYTDFREFGTIGEYLSDLWPFTRMVAPKNCRKEGRLQMKMLEMAMSKYSFDECKKKNGFH